MQEILNLYPLVGMIQVKLNEESFMVEDDSLRKFIEDNGKDCLSQAKATEFRVVVFIKENNNFYEISEFGKNHYSYEFVHENVIVIKEWQGKWIIIPEKLSEKYILFVFKNKYIIVDLTINKNQA